MDDRNAHQPIDPAAPRRSPLPRDPRAAILTQASSHHVRSDDDDEEEETKSEVDVGTSTVGHRRNPTPAARDVSINTEVAPATHDPRGQASLTSADEADASVDEADHGQSPPPGRQARTTPYAKRATRTQAARGRQGRARSSLGSPRPVASPATPLGNTRVATRLHGTPLRQQNERLPPLAQEGQRLPPMPLQNADVQGFIAPPPRSVRPGLPPGLQPYGYGHGVMPAPQYLPAPPPQVAPAPAAQVVNGVQFNFVQPGATQLMVINTGPRDRSNGHGVAPQPHYLPAPPPQVAPAPAAQVVNGILNMVFHQGATVFTVYHNVPEGRNNGDGHGVWPQHLLAPPPQVAPAQAAAVVNGVNNQVFNHRVTQNTVYHSAPQDRGHGNPPN